jgi:transcriptional regulator with XRE-family HTH domain
MKDLKKRLKQFGISSSDIAEQNGITRQWVSLLFNNYSHMHLGYQLYLLNKAIDYKIRGLKVQIQVLEQFKINAQNIVDDAHNISRGEQNENKPQRTTENGSQGIDYAATSTRNVKEPATNPTQSKV